MYTLVFLQVVLHSLNLTIFTCFAKHDAKISKNGMSSQKGIYENTKYANRTCVLSLLNYLQPFNIIIKIQVSYFKLTATLKLSKLTFFQRQPRILLFCNNWR